MKVSILTLALALFATITYGEDNSAHITIRGLNVDSSIEEIENVLGGCTPSSTLEKDSFDCGEATEGSFNSGYRINDNGKITHINFLCKHLNGCEYSTADLADLLSKKLSISEPRLVIDGDPDWGFMIDGPAGDRLFVIEIDQTIVISISANNYRKQTLNLN